MLRRIGPIGTARYALTDRYGGRSTPPYDTLDLADHVGDEPAHVAANRGLLATALGLAPDRLVGMRQVHGAEVARVERAPGAGTAPVRADALVTTAPGVALVVLVADCVPVLLGTRDGEAVAVAHAGRRGLLAGVVPATVAAMRDLGASPDQLVAVVGPAVCGRCYEVPAELAREVAAVVAGVSSTTPHGAPALDLRAGVVAQLLEAGVGAVATDPACTAECADLYSFRRDGVTGRFAGVVWR